MNNALPADDDRTVFQPGGTTPPTDGLAPPPRIGRSGLPSGTLLNAIYEVRGFLARGGMGEVYEGVNVNTDERVAIKVMLPHLAADPKVQAMFRKEARILTELAHPALVRYRVLAHEPQLELFYIVTEFIDGRALAEMLGELRPSETELKALVRRLADGLAAAHAMGAIHRDVSPDNVLLPQGRLAEAKIIDFGIARESSVAHHTVVGDGFAGKLGYVAPEQFGDFGRRIGPWTDIYSLGLVGLALAAERAPDMGVTLVEAVDRRREGVDLSPVPDALRPVFARMLAPDPSDRFQSMTEVIAAIDALDEPPAKADAAPPPPTAPVAQTETLSGEAPTGPLPEILEELEPGDQRPRRTWLYGAGALAIAAGIGAAVALQPAPAPKAPPIAITEPADGTPVAIAPIVPIAPAAEAPPTAEAAPPQPAETPPPTHPAAAAPRLAKAPLPPIGAVPARKPLSARKAETVAPLAHVVTAPQVAAAAAPVALPAAVAAPDSVASNGVEACWRANGTEWSYIGYASRATCAAQAFATCEVVHGRWGKTQLRRYDGKLQAKGTGLLAKWQTVGTSQCAATGAAP
jgi:tRNA A-37 threonylcarbamoyl transferase component Bud32